MDKSSLVASLSKCEEYQKMVRGELYYSFGPELSAARERCVRACKRFNNAENTTRRQRAELWRNILGNEEPLPPPAPTQKEDDALFQDEPYVAGSITVDYGIHLSVGPGTYINFNFTVLDTCHVKIGARVLFGPNVSIFTASHPLDPAERNGMDGPELGAPITIGDDCWIGGSVIILAGVTIGDGCTIGAGSVVTKSVEPYSVAVGNPARVIRKLERKAQD